MNNKVIKYTGILVILLLLFQFFIPAYIYPGYTAQAAIDEEDVLKGIGAALLLVLIARTGQRLSAGSNSSNSSEEFEYDLNDRDMDLLARIIHAEARGEPFSGQVAVGAVIINRVNSSDFPNTIHDVIFQAGQFCTVDDGQVHLQPNQTAIRAAQRVAQGEDPSNGALFFYNPYKSDSRFMRTRATTTIIGDHVFAK